MVSMKFYLACRGFCQGKRGTYPKNLTSSLLFFNLRAKHTFFISRECDSFTRHPLGCIIVVGGCIHHPSFCQGDVSWHVSYDNSTQTRRVVPLTQSKIISVGMCIQLSQCVLRDLANQCTDMFLSYRVPFHRSWEGLHLFEGRANHHFKRNHTKKTSSNRIKNYFWSTADLDIFEKKSFYLNLKASRCVAAHIIDQKNNSEVYLRSISSPHDKYSVLCLASEPIKLQKEFSFQPPASLMLTLCSLT